MTECETRHTGGCQCGAVRFALTAEPERASICHCRMCQKAFGSLFAPFATVRLADVVWTRGAPRLFDSSDAVERGFCANCGTPLTFAYKGRGDISVALGALDHPERIAVGRQFWGSAALPAFAHLHEQPAYEADAPGMDEIIAAIAASNHQHPDHDTGAWQPHPSRPP